MRDTRVEAVVVLPTIRLGPAIAMCWLPVFNRPEAALSEGRMSPERRRFVAERFAYWDEWTRIGGSAHHVGDWE